MEQRDRFISRLRDIESYGTRAKETVNGRTLDQMQEVEVDALCYLILIVSEATTQALALDPNLADRHPDVPWREIRATGNRLRHGYASIDREVVHDIVENGHIARLLHVARIEIERTATDG